MTIEKPRVQSKPIDGKFKGKKVALISDADTQTKKDVHLDLRLWIRKYL